MLNHYTTPPTVEIIPQPALYVKRARRQKKRRISASKDHPRRAVCRIVLNLLSQVGTYPESLSCPKATTFLPGNSTRYIKCWLKTHSAITNTAGLPILYHS